MAEIKLDGNPVETSGFLPPVGSIAPEFTLTTTRLTSKSLSDYGPTRKLLNIFPSVNTGVCAAAVRNFNEKASSLANTQVICISRDLPFSQQQFCGAEGIQNVEMLSDFKTGQFGKDYGLEVVTGAFQGLHSRVVIILDDNNKIIYTEQVPDIGQEPDYQAAFNAL
jgi:thioredoxin-dependent peroxiredoxin